MTIYKIYHDAHIEAKNGNEAEEILMEQNAANCATYYTDEAEAKKAYESIAADLDEPKKLGGGLYWFDGVVLDVAEGCDEPEEDETLADAFLTGSYTNTSTTIKKFKHGFLPKGNLPDDMRRYIENGESFDLFCAEYGWQDWMNEFTDADEDEPISDEDSRRINDYMREIWDALKEELGA